MSRRFYISTGVRLALLQTLLLVVAFLIAGSLTRVSVKLIYRNDVKTHIAGEVTALTGLMRTSGQAAVVKAVNQNGRHPGGLTYRFERGDGTALAGDLPPTGAGVGWTYLDWDDAVVPGRPYQDLLVYTARLPDGSVLTVGQDLSQGSRISKVLKKTMFWCALVGAGVGLCLSFLLSWGHLRRIDDVVAAARAVSAGQMQVRARTRTSLVPDDIDALGGAFNAMLDEITTLISRLRWVSADISHDLRTPLTHVQLRLERLKATNDPEVVQAVEAIGEDVTALLRTFDAMLRLAEIENDPEAADLKRVDLARLAAEVVEAYGPDVDASGRRLELSAEPAWVLGDADLLRNAIANLIENALRHTPPGTHIRVTVRPEGTGVGLIVADDGPGVPPEHYERVVQRFQKLDTSRATAGSGLGLPIVTAIAHRHGVKLSLADAGPGLKVSLIFPPIG
jgi:signal transduction histidine kinase